MLFLLFSNISMSSLCIIPARGGSKRIPGKNIRNFLGMPIISYPIRAALDSGLFEEVMVSTDDERIAEVARNAGAQVPFLRSSENSSDFASTVDVVLEVVEKYGVERFENVCCIYPSAPFVTVKQLVNAYDKLTSEQLDSVFPVIAYGHPIQRALFVNASGMIEPLTPEFVGVRSQDLEKRYHDAGQFYFCRVRPVWEQKRLWTDRSGAIIVKETEAQDIDSEEDWEMAELKYKTIHGI
jgi:pseudaminic acid cytidylyltransferase